MDWTGIGNLKMPPLEQVAKNAPKQLRVYGIEDTSDKSSSLSKYAGLMAPDMLLTEVNMHRKGNVGDINPIVNRAGTLGRAAYFGGAALGLSKLHDKLEKKNPKLAILFQAIIGGIQKQMMTDNINLTSGRVK